MLCAPEVIAAGLLAKPSLLTGHLESPATGWFHTVFLPLSVPIIREEELLAALALPPTMIAPHGSQIAEEQAGDSSRSGHREEEPNGKKEEQSSGSIPEEDPARRRRRFRPAVLLHFHFDGDTTLRTSQRAPSEQRLFMHHNVLYEA